MNGCDGNGYKHHCLLRVNPYLELRRTEISSFAATAAFLTKPKPYLETSSLSTYSLLFALFCREGLDALADCALRLMPYFPASEDSISSLRSGV